MDNVAERMKALRKRLGITGEKLAEECGLERTEVVAVETGKNKANSYAIRAALARGIDVPLEALAAFLDGELTLDALWILRGTYSASQWWRCVGAAVGGIVPPPPTHERPLQVRLQADPTPVTGTEIRRKPRLG